MVHRIKLSNHEHVIDKSTLAVQGDHLENKRVLRVMAVAYPGIFFFWGGVSTNSVEDRGQRERGGSPLVRGSGGSCNLVQKCHFI